jgi:hypothetical protein
MLTMAGGLLSAALLTTTVTKAASKPIVILGSLHNLDYAEAACDHLLRFSDPKAIAFVLNNASDYDTEDIKRYKEQFEGIRECKSVPDKRELGRRLENSIADQLAITRLCAGVSAYIDGHDKFDGKFNDAAQQAKERNDYWLLMVDYAPGSKVYGWSLFPEKAGGADNGAMISGEGTTAQIAEQVCIVVTGQGAHVH